MKILPWGAELLHADRVADMTKLIIAFRNFATAPNKTQASRSRFSDVQYRWHQILFPVDRVTDEVFTRCRKEIAKWIVSEADGWNIIAAELICFALTLPKPHVYLPSLNRLHTWWCDCEIPPAVVWHRLRTTWPPAATMTSQRNNIKKIWGGVGVGRP